MQPSWPLPKIPPEKYGMLPSTDEYVSMIYWKQQLIQHDASHSFPQSVVYSMETAFDGSLILGTQRGILRLVLERARRGNSLH